jgi:hypothetical protein
MLTRPIPLKCDIEDFTFYLGEQEIALLHADRQVFGGVLIGHVAGIYRPTITFSTNWFLKFWAKAPNPR